MGIDGSGTKAEAGIDYSRLRREDRIIVTIGFTSSQVAGIGVRSRRKDYGKKAL